MAGLQALALGAAGEMSQALARLERAVTLAEPGGFVRIFADEGLPLARLLMQLDRKHPASEYVSRLLIATGVTAGRLQATVAARGLAPAVVGPAQSQDLIEPLSEREIEVLQRIAEGYTKKEIAVRLIVSPNTVKSHSRSIYGKLGVHSRTQAIARSQALDPLPRG